MSRTIRTKWPASEDAVRLDDALRALPVPSGGADFDERVLAALHAPRPWWLTLWVSLRPVLASAACSLCVMLALITWSAKAPVALEPVAPDVLHPAEAMEIGDPDRLHGRPPTRANLVAALLIAPNAVTTPMPLPPSPRKAPELPLWRRQSRAPSLLA
jgi:hypothetical protein